MFEAVAMGEAIEASEVEAVRVAAFGVMVGNLRLHS